jgi:hypothetical protein
VDAEDELLAEAETIFKANRELIRERTQEKDPAIRDKKLLAWATNAQRIGEIGDQLYRLRPSTSASKG